MVTENALAVTGMRILLVATVGVCVTVAILAWRERPEPGAVPLSALMIGACWWAAALFFRLDATGLREKVFWLDLGWPGIVLIPVAWFLFSLEYTGHDQYLRRRYVLLLSVIPAISAVLGVTNSLHHFMYTESILVEHSGAILLDRTPGPWFWVIAVYTLVLGFAGTIPLLHFLTSDVGSFRGQSFALIVGALTPVFVNTFFLLGMLPTGGIDPTPISFSVSGVAFLGALTRFRLFTTNPAPIQPARHMVFHRMQEGALVIDRNDNIIDINSHAARALDVTPEVVLGKPLGSALPEIATVLENRSGSDTVRFDSENQTYDVSSSRITDTHGRLTGRVVTMHDITEHVRQQQRLEVLNRVFRHNVRTKTQVIVGNADYLATNNSERKANKVRQKALEIEDLSSQIRTVLDVFEQGRERSRPVAVHNILEECLEHVREEFPAATVECTEPPETTYVDGVLDDVLFSLVENAAQHNTNADPKVWIEVSRDGDRVRISIEDNGPGIDEAELALVKNRTETPLEHGTGFGLAVALWGTESADGEITFESRDPTGLAVTVEVPVLRDAENEHPEAASTDNLVAETD